MRESRNLGQANFNSIGNGGGAKKEAAGGVSNKTPDKIRLNEFGRQLFNINAKNYI